MVTMIRPMVTENNHRDAERTEDERMEDYDYLETVFSGFLGCWTGDKDV